MPITTTPVLVTGATGFVAAEIVKQLLENGYHVRGTTRDVDKTKADGHLTGLPGADERLELVQADLVDEGSFDGPMQGCEYVMHTASPYILDVEDPQRDLVDPAVRGTLSVMEAASRTQGVKRVVLTSSFAAISGGAKDHTWSEEHWNDVSSLDRNPYAFSKTQAERAAWDFVENGNVDFDLVVINPTGVIGPSVMQHVNQTHEFFVGATRGDYPGIVDMAFPFVDVRDVATAHLTAAFLPSATGRYIVSGHDSSFSDLAKILRDHFGDAYPFPKRTMPKWVVWLAGPLVDKAMTRKIISLNVNVPWKADNSKSIRELGVSYRPMEESLNDMFQQMVDNGVFSS